MAENFSIDLNKKTFVVQEEKKTVIPAIQKSADDEKRFIMLRDCFNAGYQFPQYCVDNNIKKPLIVGVDESQKTFLWEIYAQFRFDRRIFQAEFCLLNGNLNFAHYVTGLNDIYRMQLKNISEINLENFDKIIVLTADKTFKEKNVIYLDKLVRYFAIKTYSTIPLLSFLQKYPKVKLFVLWTPILRQSEHNTEYEKWLLENNFNVATVRSKIAEARKKGETVSTPYDCLGYSNEEVFRLLTADRKLNLDGSTSMVDDEFLHNYGGKRMTANQPEHYKNTIYFIGNCVFYGHGVPWDKTVESHLQNLLNKANLPYRVENEGQDMQYRRQDQFYILNKIDPKPGDIILFGLYAGKEIPHIDVSHALDRPHNYGECFPDPLHINENGHRGWADKIFEYLTKNNFFQDVEFNYPPPPLPPHRYGIPKENFSQNESIAEKIFDKKELEAYRKRLRERRPKIGCIVMNANPFTLGHEYLVEYASSRVNKLFVMVVSEDKSEFSFADRFELVKRGTAKFPNVEVLQTEKFISSMQTFSGYFNKENLQDVEVDSSQNDEIFAQEVAPSLGITIRFDGTEPRDKVTRRQMETLDVILPKYGIEHCVIPRREIDGQAVSAKTVRAALNNKDLDTLKKLLPQTTYDYLVEKFLPKDEK